MIQEFEKSIYEYIRSIEILMEAVDKHPRYPFDPSLGKSQKILENIHRQMELIEGISVSKKEKSADVNVENVEDIKAENIGEKTEGEIKGKKQKKEEIKKERGSVFFSNNPPPPPWIPKK